MEAAIKLVRMKCYERESFRRLQAGSGLTSERTSLGTRSYLVKAASVFGRASYGLDATCVTAYMPCLREIHRLKVGGQDQR
jgi:hypothetical protein